MADISILSRLVDGVQRNVDVSQNSLVVGSLKVGTSSPAELTKAILEKLILINSAADADGTYDSRYTKQTDLASTANAKGASLVGIEDAATNFTATNVEDALAELYAAVGSGAASGITYDNTSSGLSATNVQTAIDEVEGRVDATETVANAAIPSSEKGANNGVATLDAGGKIPTSQLPNSVMEFQGQWDASANDPELADGVGNAGDVYRVNTAGSQDLGSGSVAYSVGDWVMYNGTIWEKATNSNDVVSVNGQQGVVSLDTDDISEGATNKYFTDGRAQTATISQVITNGVTTKAPSEDAVFDALATKQAASANLDEADTFFGATNLTGAEAEQLSDGSNADSLHSHDSLKALSEVAGEAFSATTLYAVRYGQDAETAGRMYKADNDATSIDNFYAMGLAKTVGALSAGNALPAVTKSGLMTATAHGFTIGKPIYLGASGAITSTAPSAANTAVVKLGMVKDANTLDIQMQVMGVN